MRVSTRAQIANLHHTLKTTTIYVTHDQVEAMTLADRVVVMNKGVAQQVAPPMEIYDRPANTFVASFIGAPAMNLIEGEIANGTFTSPVLRVEGLPHPVSGPVTLGFRAEDVEVVSEGGNLSAPVYSVEKLGDSTMFAIRAKDDMIALKAGKAADMEIGETVHARIPPGACHVFGPDGQRVEAIFRISTNSIRLFCHEIGLTVTSSIKGLPSTTKVTSLSVMLCPLCKG